MYECSGCGDLQLESQQNDVYGCHLCGAKRVRVEYARAAAAAARFVAEACEASGVRPKMAAGYRALEDRLVSGEPVQAGDERAVQRAVQFRNEHLSHSDEGR